MNRLKRTQLFDNDFDDGNEAKRFKNENDFILENMFNVKKNQRIVEQLVKQEAHIKLISLKHESDLKSLSEENLKLTDELNSKKNDIDQLQHLLQKSKNGIADLVLKNEELNRIVQDIRDHNLKLEQQNEDLIKQNELNDLISAKRLEDVQSENLQLKLDLTDCRHRIGKLDAWNLKQTQLLNNYCNFKIEHKIELIKLEAKHKNEIEQMRTNY